MTTPRIEDLQAELQVIEARLDESERKLETALVRSTVAALVCLLAVVAGVATSL